MTWAMLLATYGYVAACFLAWVAPGLVPYEVIIFGGLILILGWRAHDAIHERKAAA